MLPNTTYHFECMRLWNSNITSLLLCGEKCTKKTVDFGLMCPTYINILSWDEKGAFQIGYLSMNLAFRGYNYMGEHNSRGCYYLRGNSKHWPPV